jgi:hypothetical protein
MATAAAAYLDTERKGHDAVFVLSQYKIKKNTWFENMLCGK